MPERETEDKTLNPASSKKTHLFLKGENMIYEC